MSIFSINEFAEKTKDRSLCTYFGDLHEFLTMCTRRRTNPAVKRTAYYGFIIIVLFPNPTHTLNHFI